MTPGISCKRPSRWTALATCGALLGAALLTNCMRSLRMPAVDGAVIEVRRSDRSIGRGEAGFDSSLQLSWFGSGCHLIQLGELSVLTDPFVTNGPSLTNFESDEGRVRKTFGRIEPPQAVLINHCHFDHFLDAYAALALARWRKEDVPLYGGVTCRNLIAGWNDDEVKQRCHPISKDSPGIKVAGLPAGYRMEIRAYPGTHGPHLKCGYTAFDGGVAEERSSPPDSIDDYKTGETFNYWIKLSKGRKSFTIFYLGAIGDLNGIPQSFPDGRSLDVVLLCVPGADNVKGFRYPEDVLKRLQPRHVVLSHFNTFLREDPDEQLSVSRMDLVNLNDFARKVQEAGLSSPNFEKLHIPAITRMEARGRGRNVVVLK